MRQTDKTRFIFSLLSSLLRLSATDNHRKDNQRSHSDTLYTNLATAGVGMDLLEQLPLECLQSILQTLAHQDDVSTLATLLRVNKYIASITLPYLYQEPFQNSFHQWKWNSNEANCVDTMDHLLRMLLTHYGTGTLSDDDIPKVVSLHFNIAAYRSTITISTNPRPLNYAAHIRHLSLQGWAFSKPRFHKKVYPPEVQEYINGPEFMALYPFDLFVLRYEHSDRQNTIRLLCLRMLLHREATWMLASPILEQLQTLVIPTSDVNRYLGVLDRLGQLECVRFLLDEVFDFHPAEERLATEEWIERAQARKDKAMGSLLQFVERHTQLFNGQLRIVTCHSSYIWMGGTPQTCPAEIQFQFLRMLPPLHNPRTLDASNVMQFAAHLEATNIGNVEKITLILPAGALLDRLRDNRQFLQRCRAATHLRLTSLGKGSFNWAVEEKRAVRDSMGNNTLITKEGSSSSLLLQHDGQPACLQHGLVALEEVWIRDYMDASTDEVDDIAIAFSQTLRDFRVSILMRLQDIPPAFHFGRGWVDMMVLARLSLDTSWARMVLDRELLVRCPNLTFACLEDRTIHYQCPEIVPSVSAQLSRLVTLRLSGWSGLTFHPDTLYSTSELRTLDIGMATGMHVQFNHEYCFIPPVEELNRSYNIHIDNDNADDSTAAESATTSAATAWEAPQIIRPRWTWDWQLLHLTQLRFCGEFAYLFEFRMLRGCPTLEMLHLNMLTSDRTHTRALSMADLVLPSSNIIGNHDSNIGASYNDYSHSHSPSSSSTTTPERIIMPVLSRLRLAGNWIIEDEFLFEFLGVTFPKLENLIAVGWIGFTLGGLFSVARAVTQPWKLINVVQPEPDRDTRAELGVQSHTEVSVESRVLPTELLFDGLGEYTKYFITQEPGSSVATISEND